MTCLHIMTCRCCLLNLFLVLTAIIQNHKPIIANVSTIYKILNRRKHAAMFWSLINKRRPKTLHSHRCGPYPQLALFWQHRQWRDISPPRWSVPLVGKTLQRRLTRTSNNPPYAAFGLSRHHRASKLIDHAAGAVKNRVIRHSRKGEICCFRPSIGGSSAYVNRSSVGVRSLTL